MRVRPNNQARAPTRFAFILQPEFPLAALILASETLRIANQNSGQDLFQWQFISEDGQDTRASNGMWFAADCDTDGAEPADVYMLFEGNLPTQHISKKLLGFLRAAALFGAFVGGVDTGAYALAQTGLVGTEKAPDVVLHWEAVPTFREWFADALPLNQIYQIADKRVHCAGGIATLDMMLALMTEFVDEAMANEVANAMIHTQREARTRQREDQRFEGEANKSASKLVTLMEQNLDFPLPLVELANRINVPVRTLSRISHTAFGISPMRLYLRIRLQAARNFLFYEEHSIKEIAIACGFSFPAVFSRCFKTQFGLTPSTFRSEFRKQQKLKKHPEIHRLIRQ